MIFDNNSDSPFFANTPITATDVNRWVERNLPPFEEMERVTRSVLDMHGDDDESWDGLHAFVLYEHTGDVETLQPAVMMGIVPTIHPRDYPAVLNAQTQQFLATRLDTMTSKPIVACALMMEAWALERQPTEEERKLINDGKLHTIADAVERCMVGTVDVAGRVWIASKNRSNPQDVTFYDVNERGEIYGRMPDMMIRIMGAISAMHTLAEAV